MLAYVDKDTGQVTSLKVIHTTPEGGRNCAKGPATINQIQDTERILHPLRRVGARGEGGWEQITWEEALDEIAGKFVPSKAGASTR